MLLVVNHVGVVLLFLHLLLKQSGVFLGAENDRVFVQPIELAWPFGEFGERPRFAAVRIEQPDLRSSRIRLGIRPLARTHKCNQLAVRRPARLGVMIRAARQLNFRALGKARQKKI